MGEACGVRRRCVRLACECTTGTGPSRLPPRCLKGRIASKVFAGRQAVITVALGHFASDFAALGPSMLYPILAVRLDMTYGMIGLAALAWAITTSVIQPLFGYVGDRMGRRWLASLSPAWIAVWVAMAAFAPSYPLLVVYLVVAAVGVAAFHPQGAAIANEAQGHNTGTNVALFFLGGHAAFAVGPLILGVVLATGGAGWMPVVLAPVLVVSSYMAWSLRSFRAPQRPSVSVTVGRRALGGISAALVGLLLVAVVRGWAYAALATFIPVFVSPDRPDPLRAGIVLSAHLIGHAAAAFAAGVYTDRFGVRRILGVSSLVMIPALLAFGLMPFGPWHIPARRGDGGGPWRRFYAHGRDGAAAAAGSHGGGQRHGSWLVLRGRRRGELRHRHHWRRRGAEHCIRRHGAGANRGAGGAAVDAAPWATATLACGSRNLTRSSSPG